MNRRGFTLIELLVVISIIGLLSSVILASLSVARQKGQIAAGQLFNTSTYHALGANEVGDWNFNETTGTSVLDWSGNGDTGTITGSVTRVAGLLGSGNALLFSGGYVLMPASTVYGQMGDSFTVSAWINTTDVSPGVRHTIFSMGAPGPGQNRDFVFGIGSDGPNCVTGRGSLEVYKPGVYVACTVGGVSANVWTNVAYTKNGPLDPGKFYVNGQSIPNALTQATFNFSLATTNSYIAAIGSRTDNIPSFTFSGMIDEVKVYNQALASADIEQIYAMGALSHGLALK